MTASLTVSIAVVQAGASVTVAVPATQVEYIELASIAAMDNTGKFQFKSEIALVIDALKLSTAKALQDTFGVADAQQLQPTKSLADSFEFTDDTTRSFEKALADSISQPDALAKFLARPLADSFTLADAANKTPGKALSSSFDLTDQQTVEATKSLQDSISFTETLYRVLVFIRDAADEIAAVDNAAITVSKGTFVDDVSTSDASVHEALKFLSDAVAMDDGTSIGDGSTYQFFKNLNNVVFVSDSLSSVVAKPVAELVAPTDSGLVNAQSYGDPSYFAEDYAGVSLSF